MNNSIRKCGPTFFIPWFCINLKYNNICRTKLREFLNRHDPFSRMELTADCPTLVLDDNEANWILEEALQPDVPGIKIETYLAGENGIYIICGQGRCAT